jgi:2-amino-4-hydroxy-6-hydroxymethyldihydropteridine diphosphokinase
LVLDEPSLRLPHPEMHKRDFVLAPFCEVWPAWRHPALDRTAEELLASLRADAQRP